MKFIPSAKAAWHTAAEKFGPDASAQVDAHIEGVQNGTIAAIPMPWRNLTRLTKALLPGTISVLCGDGGASKSLLILQLCYSLFSTGVPVAIYELECSVKFHSLRLVSQLSGEPGITDPDWILKQNGHTRAVVDPHQEAIRNFGYQMTASPDQQVSYDELLNWMRVSVKAGKRVLFVDPITAATPEREPWIADSRFITEARKIIEPSGASLVVVTHPKKGRKGAVGMDELSGGAAWSRFTDTVIWLVRPTEPVQVRIAGPFGSHTEPANRVIVICKARNGIGTGLKVGMKFSSESLTFEELGIVEDDA